MREGSVPEATTKDAATELSSVETRRVWGIQGGQSGMVVGLVLRSRRVGMDMRQRKVPWRRQGKQQSVRNSWRPRDRQG